MTIINEPVVENSRLAKSFAGLLATFRAKFPSVHVSDILNEFQSVLLQESNGNEDMDLEWLFWTLLNSLMDLKFDSSIEIELESSSHSKIQQLCSSDRDLNEWLKILNVLNQYTLLTMHSDIDFQELLTKLPHSKWQKTKTDMLIGESKFFSIDSDSIYRDADQNASLNESDSKDDEIFYQMAYYSILSNNFNELKEICELTSNFEFLAIVQGHYSNPEFNYESFPLWRRTMFQLTKVTSGKWQRSCYGLLCGDVLSSCQGSKTFEQKLYCYLNNMFQDKLEADSKLNSNLQFPKPPLSVNSISEALDIISQDVTNNFIENQSRHPIRVLIGSLISDNSDKIMEFTITSIRNDSVINETPYLLRILTHFAIVLHLSIGDKILKVDDYVEILKVYCLRLLLHKNYYQIPVYISFIPSINNNDDLLIDTYSTILSQFSNIDGGSNEANEEVNNDSYRIEQIKSMRNLQLPVQEILQLTLTKVFEQTKSNYPTDTTIELNYKCDEIDQSLFEQLKWFILADMIPDSISGTKILLSRFLITGKIGSCLKVFESLNLPDLINRASVQYLDVNKLDLLEIIQYHHLIITIKQIIKVNNVDSKMDLKSVLKLSNDLTHLITNWLVDLLNDSDIDKEETQFLVELRRIYLPTIILTNIDLLIEYKNLSDKLIINQLKDFIILLSDEQYKLWEIFQDNDNQILKDILKTIANLTSELWDENGCGIFI